MPRNLGVSGRAYVAVGGFLPLLVHEDVALMQALLTTGMAIVWAEDIAVSTSARRHARTPGGFAGYLNDLEQSTLSLGPEELVTVAHPARETASTPSPSRLSSDASAVATA